MGIRTASQPRIFRKPCAASSPEVAHHRYSVPDGRPSREDHRIGSATPSEDVSSGTYFHGSLRDVRVRGLPLAGEEVMALWAGT